MAAGWSVMDALNKNSKAAVEEKPKARFRTKDISIKKMYSNDRNFYSMPDVSKLAQEILAVGMLENMTVTYAPCEKGEYRIIAGERRWRALKMLVEKGHEEFEIATCQIKTPAEEHEETVQLIMANAYRDKTASDIVEEEQRLKESLQYMRDNGLKLQGYSLDSGRLRDVIAQIMNTTPTRIAQIESINNRLIPEFSQELKEGRLTFSAAYEISGMAQEKQEELLERYRENGLTWKEVKEAKKEEAEKHEKTEIEELQEGAGQETDEGEETAGGEETEEWEQAHPESITSLCFSCKRYQDCNVKTGTCKHCDRYANKAEAEKTPEQKYDEEQKRIDKETKKRLEEMKEREEEEILENASQDREERVIFISESMFRNIASGKVPYMITKQQKEKYREKEIVKLAALRDGEETGLKKRVCITCTDDSETSSAIVEGYCVIGVMDIYDAEALGIIDLGDEE